ncbi:MAG: hypothetical protein CYPHOPRED_000809 [Cyphobasidiales sp. Tagirdzhanova-0007]|nr:MAG: hypothetical protein CYPHOPRED_000809 [Cyphobasidiales sp. Tagirdzhanova-0007]
MADATNRRTMGYRGALAFSSSRAQNSPAEANAVYGVLSKNCLYLYDKALLCNSDGATTRPVCEVVLTDFASVAPGPIQQGLTWEFTLKARSIDTTVRKKSSIGVPTEQGRESKKSRFATEKSWLKNKLRSKSVSAAANTDTHMAFTGKDSLTSTPSPDRHSRLPHHSGRPATSNTPISPFSPPQTASITLSTISKDTQQGWISAVSFAIGRSVSASASASPPSDSCLSSLAATGQHSRQNITRRKSPSPLSFVKGESPGMASFLEVEPPSPRSYRNSNTSIPPSPTEVSNADKRVLNSVNPRLPLWLAEVLNTKGKAISNASQSSDGHRDDENAAPSTIQAHGIEAAVSLDSDDHQSKGQKGWSANKKPIKDRNLQSPSLRPSTSSSSLGSSRLGGSVCSTAPSTDLPTPKPSPLGSHYTSDTYFRGKDFKFVGNAKSQAVPSLLEGGGADCKELRKSVGSLSPVSKQPSKSASLNIPSEIRRDPPSDISTVGSRILDPAELRRRLLERGIHSNDTRPSTAPNNNLSKFTFGKALPAQSPKMAVEMDLQKLFAALPPPRRRTVAAISSSSSILSLAAPALDKVSTITIAASAHTLKQVLT